MVYLKSRGFEGSLGLFCYVTMAIATAPSRGAILFDKPGVVLVLPREK